MADTCPHCRRPTTTDVNAWIVQSEKLCYRATGTGRMWCTMAELGRLRNASKQLRQMAREACKTEGKSATQFNDLINSIVRKAAEL